MFFQRGGLSFYKGLRDLPQKIQAALIGNMTRGMSDCTCCGVADSFPTILLSLTLLTSPPRRGTRLLHCFFIPLISCLAPLVFSWEVM